jgi:aminopeptidase YwaD
MYRLLTVFLLIVNPLFGQKARKEHKTIISNLERHVRYLSDDRLEGRRAGSEGERLASEYIAQQFKNSGLRNMSSTEGFYQTFNIDDGKRVYDGASITVDGTKKLSYPIHFQPLAYSPAANSLNLKYNSDIKEKGNAWKLDVSELIESNKDNPHFDAPSALKSEINRLAGQGARAVIVTRSAKDDIDLAFKPKDRSEQTLIPAFYIDESILSEYLNDSISEFDLNIDYNIVQSKRSSRNVVGWIDNKAETNIVIGAHYDHLGFGEDGNSMLRSQEKQIHNGADDNASGTASLLELARLLSSKNPKTHNYIFVAFSGEELGLHGSKHFVENTTEPNDRTCYMVNLDMVGRLNDSSKTITVGGYGTAVEWGKLLSSHSYDPGFKMRFDSSGTGPSDHTSFYRKDIPVLFFFTGLHTDYHKPSDDHEKINYDGSMRIVRYIYDLIGRTKSYKRLQFRRTREQQTSTNTRFSVSLGIMPDYTYSGTGVRVDGVTEGRPAKAAGIKTGDIVVKLGEMTVDSVESYMKALSGYKKGDKTKVSVKRGSETMIYDISF